MSHRFKGKRIDNGEWVKGFYFKAPLTAENFTGSFSSGVERHCISDDDGVVFEVEPETISIVETDAVKILHDRYYRGHPIRKLQLTLARIIDRVHRLFAIH